MSLTVGGLGSRGLVHYVITQQGVVERHYLPEVQQDRIVIEISSPNFRRHCNRQQINQTNEPARQRPPADETEAAR